MSDGKDSNERDHIGEDYEDILTDDIEVLELVKLSLQKNIDTMEKEYDKSNQIDIIDNK